MKRYTIKIEGMGCMHCVNGVTAALSAIGAKVISVEIGTAVVEFGDDTQPLKDAIEDRGFDVKEITVA